MESSKRQYIFFHWFRVGGMFYLSDSCTEGASLDLNPARQWVHPLNACDMMRFLKTTLNKYYTTSHLKGHWVITRNCPKICPASTSTGRLLRDSIIKSRHSVWSVGTTKIFRSTPIRVISVLGRIRPKVPSGRLTQ